MKSPKNLKMEYMYTGCLLKERNGTKRKWSQMNQILRYLKKKIKKKIKLKKGVICKMSNFAFKANSIKATETIILLQLSSL